MLWGDVGERWRCDAERWRGRNLGRVGGLLGTGPRVGLRASGQPWALGRNPVGIVGAAEVMGGGVWVEVRP